MSQRMFAAVSRLRSGYDPDEVDAFFTHAREAYEGGVDDPVTAADVRSVAFDLVRGGYGVEPVDAALDRLEAAFVARAREQFVARHGQDAWMRRLADTARTLYGRLNRPDGERFAPAGRGEPAYDRADVDALCRRLTAYFDHGTPITAQEVRQATFRRRHGSGGYAEGPVDAFCRRAVDVLLGAQ